VSARGHKKRARRANYGGGFLPMAAGVLAAGIFVYVAIQERKQGMP
jgi:hypothetical protein